jgi:hypothetical protein
MRRVERLQDLQEGLRLVVRNVECDHGRDEIAMVKGLKNANEITIQYDTEYHSDGREALVVMEFPEATAFVGG